MSPLRIAFIDDDPFVSAHLEPALHAMLPDAELYVIEEPLAPAGYDVYVIDNDFGGSELGGALSERVRAVAPGALLLGYSSKLGTGFLRRLMRIGVRDVFDKRSALERQELIETIVAEDARRKGRVPRRLGAIAAIRAVTELLREWNRRLERRPGGEF